MKTLIYSALSLVMLFAFASCDNANFLNDKNVSETSSINFLASLGIDTATLSASDLTQSEIDGLMLMREEEKMAMDVYNYFYNMYGLNIFTNIASSEAKHASSVLTLITAYGLTDPAATTAGVFNNASLQNLYDQLIAMGSDSIIDALKVGALIEETDILDIQNLINSTTNIYIITVFTNLMNGSNNHLRSFVLQLSNYSITYVPQVLPQDAYDEILASSNENGGSGYRGGK